jgi:flagellar basal-body rod modification protein FlgD
MTTVSSTSSTNKTADAINSSSSDPLNNIDTDEFLKLMIAELQNQDPLNPADNTQLLTQMSQIRQVAASDKLSSTLDTVLLGQNLTNGTSLIGKTVKALGADGKDISGKVSKVTVANNDVQVYIGDQSVKLTNIREILPAT